MAKDKTYNKLIHTTRWLRLRRDILSARPMCARCEEEGRTRLASEVHHKRPVQEAYSERDKVQLMFDPLNLQPLCHECHNLTHMEMRSHSREGNKERAKRLINNVKKKYFT